MEGTLKVGVVIGAALGNKYFSTFDSAEQKAVKLGKAFNDTDRKLHAANGVIKYRKLLQTLKDKQAAAGGGSKKLAAGIKDVEERYKKAKRAAKGYGISIGSVVKEQKALVRQSSILENKLGRLNKAQEAKDRLGALKTRALGAAGLVYGASRVIGNAFDVETQEIRLETVINANDGDAKKAVERAREHTLNFAKNSLASQSELLEIKYALSSAGLSEDASRIGSEVASKLATVTNGASEQVAEIIGTTFNNMGNAIEGSSVDEKISRIGDVLAKTQLKYQIRDFSQLGESMKMAAAQANISRISLEETSVAIGLLNSAGLQGSQGGTAFSATLRQMKKASDDLGFSIERQEDGQMDLAATLSNVKEALAVYDDIDEQGQVIQDIFGDEGKRGLVALIDGLDKFNSGLKEVNESQGLVNDKYQLFKDKASGQWKMTVQNFSLIGHALANTLLPAINFVLKPIGWLFSGLSTIVDKAPVVGWVLGGLATSFILYSTGLGISAAAQWLWNTSLVAGYGNLFKLVAGVTWAKTVFVASSAKIGVVTAAQWLWNAAMTANPIGLIIAGVGLLVGGAYLLYKNWDKVTVWFNSALDTIAEKFSWIGDLWNSIFGDGDEEKKITTVEELKKSGIGSVASKPTVSLDKDTDFKNINPSKNSSSNINVQNHNKITVVQQPGENSEELARRIFQEELKASEREARTQQRAALYDYQEYAAP
ncbi:Phage tail length tape-measure protein [gamma proteobacterium IMCC1989]|nr:Phage tail length tape-measure protein [gamma proteobacterium IMCC1989]